MIVAIGMEETAFFSGVTINVEGAIPKLQVHIAPPSTQNPILRLLSILDLLLDRSNDRLHLSPFDSSCNKSFCHLCIFDKI